MARSGQLEEEKKIVTDLHVFEGTLVRQEQAAAPLAGRFSFCSPSLSSASGPTSPGGQEALGPCRARMLVAVVR